MKINYNFKPEIKTFSSFSVENHQKKSFISSHLAGKLYLFWLRFSLALFLSIDTPSLLPAACIQICSPWIRVLVRKCSALNGQWNLKENSSSSSTTKIELWSEFQVDEMIHLTILLNGHAQYDCGMCMCVSVRSLYIWVALQRSKHTNTLSLYSL